MENKTIFSDLALHDLENIVLYISKDSAIEFYNNLIEKDKMLISLPNLGPLIPDKKLSSKGYRMLIIDSYILFYKINENEIRILRVLHGSRDYPNLL